MSGKNGSSGFLVFLVIILILAAALSVIMYYPPAQPAKDFIAGYFPAISGAPATDETASSSPMQPITPPASAGQQPNTGPGVIPPPAPATGEQNAAPSPGVQLPGFLTNPFGIGSAQTLEGSVNAGAASDNSPSGTLKSCMAKLQNRDIIGAEQFVSDNGRKMTLNGMTGVHKLLFKNLIDLHAFDEIGYKDIAITGQTAWVPVYSNLDTKNRMVALYIILANRGVGWQVDDLYDPRR